MPSPASPWHFAQLRLKSFAPAWLAVGFLPNGLLASVETGASPAPGPSTTADCCATTSNVVVNITDAAISAGTKGLDIHPVRHPPPAPVKTLAQMCAK